MNSPFLFLSPFPSQSSSGLEGAGFVFIVLSDVYICTFSFKIFGLTTQLACGKGILSKPWKQTYGLS